jgi:colanic acid/amylovoran biosynthesis glycosyltransferase
MRVAFLVSTFPKLSETFILNQITGLLDGGHEVSVFAQRRPETATRHAVVDEYALLDRTTYTDAPDSYRDTVSLIARILRAHPAAVGHVVESVARGKAGGERLANLETLLEYPDLSEFDVVHGHFGTTSKSFDFLVTDERFGVDDGVPFVSSFYGYDVSEVLRSDPDAYADLFPLCDAVTALSDDMVDRLVEAGCPPEKLVKQQLAIDTTRYRFRPRRRDANEPFGLLTVARFTEKKGLSYAVDAVARLADDYDLTYRIAGDGPLRESIERRVARRGIEDAVEFLGWVDQETVEAKLAEAHGFLLPSVTASDGDEEGTPTVLLEAQASGLPVVSTYHAGIPEIVADGESGYLVPERDVEALTGALRRLFESEPDWPRMGRRGCELVESNHSIPVMTDRLEGLYRSL